MPNGPEPRRWALGSLILSIAAISIAGFEACSNQRATHSELRLLRQQVIGSLRPILVPGPPAVDVSESEGITRVRLPLRNISNAPTLGGKVALVSVLPDSLKNREVIEAPPFPTCDGVDAKPYEDTFTYASIPPIAPLDTATVLLEVLYDTPRVGGDAYCGAAVYADAAAAQWITDWSWTRLGTGEQARGLQSFHVRETEQDPAIPGLYYEQADPSR